MGSTFCYRIVSVKQGKFFSPPKLSNRKTHLKNVALEERLSKCRNRNINIKIIITITRNHYFSNYNSNKTLSVFYLFMYIESGISRNQYKWLDTIGSLIQQLKIKLLKDLVQKEKNP